MGCAGCCKHNHKASSSIRRRTFRDAARTAVGLLTIVAHYCGK